MARTRARPPSRALVWALAAVVAAGIAARTVGLGAQVVLGDEIHAVLAVRSQTLGELVTRFQPRDPSLPIAAFARLLATTAGLEEWGLRVLALVPGCLLLVLAAAAPRSAPAGARLLAAAVAASSPLFVYWSRTARPYAAVALLSAVAVVSFTRDARGGRDARGTPISSPRGLTTAAACLAAAVAFTPTALPSVAALILAGMLYGAWTAPPGARPRAARRAALAGAGSLALAALLLAPALPSLVEVAGRKLERSPGVGPATLVESARLLFGWPAGQPSPWLWLPTLVALGGWLRLLRGRPPAALALALAVLVPAAAYAAVPVQAIDRAPAFVRYQAAAVPLVLALYAHGLDGAVALFERATPVPAVVWRTAAVLGLAAQAVLGPLGTFFPPRHPLGPQASKLLLDGAPVDAARASAFYRELAGSASGPLVEWPFRAEHKALMRALQEVHGRPVVRCFPPGRPDALPLAFRTLVFGFSGWEERVPPGWRLVLHRRPEDEWRHLRGAGGAPPPASAPRAQALVFSRARAACRAAHGEPVYEDEWVTVFAPAEADEPSAGPR